MEAFREIVLAGWRTSMPMVVVLLGALMLDTFMGMLVAFVRQKLNSTVSRKGIARKIAAMGVVVLAGLLDPFVPDITIPFIGIVSITGGTAFYLFLNEAVSVTEKAAMLGCPLPPKLISSLEKLRADVDK